MKPLAPGRTRCCVPYCGRTFKVEPGSEVMCGKHWRMGPAAWRSRHRKLRRMATAAELKHEMVTYDRIVEICNRLWERIKERCIGVAMGCGT